jgi:hypothetical protein
LVTSKVLQKEENKYFQIGPQAMCLPLSLSIKINPTKLETWEDPTMYLVAANIAVPPSPQMPTQPQPRRGEVMNQILYEKMV